MRVLAFILCVLSISSAQVLASCAPGWQCPVGGEPVPCPENTFSTGGQALCTPCPAGQGTNTTGNTRCNLCKIGTYNSVPGTGCIVCPQDFMCQFEGMTKPVACESYLHAPPGSNRCWRNINNDWKYILGSTLGIIAILFIVALCRDTGWGCCKASKRGCISCWNGCKKCCKRRSNTRQEDGCVYDCEGSTTVPYSTNGYSYGLTGEASAPGY